MKMASLPWCLGVRQGAGQQGSRAAGQQGLVEVSKRKRPPSVRVCIKSPILFSCLIWQPHEEGEGGVGWFPNIRACARNGRSPREHPIHSFLVSFHTSSKTTESAGLRRRGPSGILGPRRTRPSSEWKVEIEAGFQSRF